MTAGSPTRWMLLGSPHLLVAGAEAAPARIEIPETAPGYLGLFLAVQRGWVSRETVAAYLWPALPEERSQHNLRVALNRLGTLLQGWGQGAALVAERRRLRLDATSDLADFLAAAAAGQWERAAGLPAGPLLHGTQFTPYPALAEWLVVEREAVRRVWAKALLQAASAGAPVEPASQRYLAAHGGDAEIAALLAGRLAAAGRGAEAHEVLATFRRAVADELPAADVQAQLQQVEHALAGVAGSTPTFGAPAGLIGREGALQGLQQAVSQQRWVTVVGLAGSGKSALAAGWYEQLEPAARSATLRVAVDAKTSPEAIVDALVARLGSGTAARRPRAAADRLAPLQGQLVLDGLDPSAAEPALLALLQTMAAQCPGLRVLATSRAALGVAGEHVLRLEGLPLEPVAYATHSPAAQLFLREAKRIRPDLRWAEHDAQVERIVRLTGGLPLALRLAAAWSRWLEPRAIVTEIERSARRERAAFDPTLADWLQPLHTRLSPSQRQALQALALFPRAFDMRAAVAVSGESAATIDELIAHCLVDADFSGDGPRLRLHPLVRAHALARLAESPARRREAVARYVAQVESMLGGRRAEHGQPVNLRSLVGPCLGEVHAAWSLALETGALASLALLVQALLQWYEGAGHQRAGAALLAAAEEALDASLPAEAAVLAGALMARATLLYRAGDYDAAERLAAAAAGLAAATAQPRVERNAVNVRGLCLWMLMRLNEAQAALEAGLRSATDDGEVRWRAVFNGNLALVHKKRGDYKAAEHGLRQAIEANREGEQWWGLASMLNNLGNLLRHQRRFDESEALALECLRMTHEHRLDTVRPHALISLALLRHASGRADDAEQYLALFDGCEAGIVEQPTHAAAATLRGRMALDRGDGAAALRHIADALARSVDSDDSEARAEALLLYGHWLCTQGRRGEALRLWSALLTAPATPAVVRDDLQTELAAHDAHTGSPAAAGKVDLGLLIEQVLSLAAAPLGAQR